MSEEVLKQPVKDFAVPTDLLVSWTERELFYENFRPSMASAANRIFMVYNLGTAGQTAAAYPMDLSTMRTHVQDADAKERYNLARRFAARASHVAGIDGIYAHVEDDHLHITVLIDELDLDRELELRAAFIELAREIADSSTVDLSVLATDDPAAKRDELGQSV